MGLDRSYTGATDHQRQLTEDAINGSSFPWDRIALTVAFHFVSEEAMQGSNHFDKNRYLFGDTHLDSGTAIIRIWDQLDVHGVDEYEGSDFFEETIIHEIGHALQFTYMGSDDLISTLVGFYHDDGGQKGAFSDWFPTSAPWEHRIIEGWAEFFKDVFFDGRKFDDRTDWKVDEGDFLGWVNFVGEHLCAGAAGGGYSQSGFSDMPGAGGIVTVTGRKFRLLNGSNTLGFYNPATVSLTTPWLGALPHLEPLTRIRDNADLFGLIDTDNVYWGYDGSGNPVTMAAAGFGQRFIDWPWADLAASIFQPGGGFFSFELDETVFGDIANLNVQIDGTITDPNGVILSANPGGRAPQHGVAGVDAYVPEAFALQSVGTPFSGLVSIWDLANFVGPADGLSGQFSGGILIPLKGPCGPLPAKWPYKPNEYAIGTPNAGHIRHKRPVTGGGGVSSQ